MDKVKYVICSIIALIIVIVFFIGVDYSSPERQDFSSNIPRIGSNLWTFDYNNKIWEEYKQKDLDTLTEKIVLQVKQPESTNSRSIYKIITKISDISVEDFGLGEDSLEFIKDKKLYSYYPKNFEYYEIIFNGIGFVSKKLSEEEISNIFKGYNIVKLSSLKEEKNTVFYSMLNNKFLILNDIGNKFYKYYIVPNDSKNMKIGKYSDQFFISDDTEITIQRLEGCSKRYPCYYLDMRSQK